MAEEKKFGGGGKPSGDKKAPAPKKDPFVEIVELLLAVVIIIYLLNGFISLFSSNTFISSAWDSIFPSENATGPRPLSEKGILLSHTKPVSSLNNPIGASVVSLGTTAVYNSPGGRQIGSQSLGAHGKITQGPVEVNGQKYYFVQFDSGKSGWVRGDDIGAMVSQPSPAESFLLWFYSSDSLFMALSILLSLALIAWVVYLFMELKRLRQNEHDLLYPKVETEVLNINPKWKRVLSHLDSPNENDWKLAIIECDIMLNEILDKMNLPGQTMGDKMKVVDKSNFNTIDNAWEAHKARNQVAHEGGDYVLTAHEARRVVGLYQTVFEEFKIL